VPQVVELLPSKCEALSSNARTTKKKCPSGFILTDGFRGVGPSWWEGCGTAQQFTLGWQVQRRGYRKCPGQDIAPKDMHPVTHFLQPGLIFYLSPSPNGAITVGTHQEINPFGRPESTDSSSLWKPAHTPATFCHLGFSWLQVTENKPKLKHKGSLSVHGAEKTRTGFRHDLIPSH
jgi:hypothetical protein